MIWIVTYAKPVLKLERGIADRAVFHERDEIKNVAAHASTSRRHTRVGMAHPRIFPGMNDEAQSATLRRVGWQWTAPTQLAAINTVQYDAILCEGHFHRNVGLHRSKINPVSFHRLVSRSTPLWE